MAGISGDNGVCDKMIKKKDMILRFSKPILGEILKEAFTVMEAATAMRRLVEATSISVKSMKALGIKVDEVTAVIDNCWDGKHAARYLPLKIDNKDCSVKAMKELGIYMLQKQANEGCSV